MNWPKTMVVLGLTLTAVGAFFWLAPKVPGLGALVGRLGRLPGDIRYESDRVSFYFPWVTCLVVSVVLSLLFRLFGRGS